MLWFQLPGWKFKFFYKVYVEMSDLGFIIFDILLKLKEEEKNVMATHFVILKGSTFYAGKLG